MEDLCWLAKFDLVRSIALKQPFANSTVFTISVQEALIISQAIIPYSQVEQVVQVMPKPASNPPLPSASLPAPLPPLAPSEASLS